MALRNDKRHEEAHNNQNCYAGSHIIQIQIRFGCREIWDIFVDIWLIAQRWGWLQAPDGSVNLFQLESEEEEEVNLEQAAKRSVLTKGRDEIMETPLPPLSSPEWG